MKTDKIISNGVAIYEDYFGNRTEVEFAVATLESVIRNQQHGELLAVYKTDKDGNKTIIWADKEAY